ncbi:MAG: hypothetical protein WA913_07190 [Pricia sp.]
MKTAQEPRPGIRETEKNALVLRLELNQKDLDRLRGQLSSYRYEPKTYNLFERMESLRNGLDQLSKTNLEIIVSIREKRKQVDNYVESVKQQFAEFNTLHRKIEDYIQGALAHGKLEQVM